MPRGTDPQILGLGQWPAPGSGLRLLVGFPGMLAIYRRLRRAEGSFKPCDKEKIPALLYKIQTRSTNQQPLAQLGRSRMALHYTVHDNGYSSVASVSVLGVVTAIKLF
jgi:hypothetical protein